MYIFMIFKDTDLCLCISHNFLHILKLLRECLKSITCSSFNNMVMTDRHLSLSQTRRVHYTHSHPILDPF